MRSAITNGILAVVTVPLVPLAIWKGMYLVAIPSAIAVAAFTMAMIAEARDHRGRR